VQWLVLGIALLLLALGGWLLWRARRLRASTGLPAGTVTYADTADWQPVQRPLLSRRYGLVGKPDYVVKPATGAPIPVEVKSRRRPAQPPRHHILQLATYCLLIEETSGSAPPHGLLHYADATLEIPFTPELRRAVLQTAEAIRRGRGAADLGRDHDDPARCRYCGVRHACDQALT
jgi:CRISPR-associated exonuclease Cas4